MGRECGTGTSQKETFLPLTRTGSSQNETSQLTGTGSPQNRTLSGTGSSQNQTLTGTRFSQNQTLTGTGSSQSKTLTGTDSSQTQTLTGTGSSQSKTVTGTGYSQSNTLTATGSSQNQTVTGTGYSQSKTLTGTGSSKNQTLTATKSSQNPFLPGSGSTPSKNLQLTVPGSSQKETLLPLTSPALSQIMSKGKEQGLSFDRRPFEVIKSLIRGYPGHLKENFYDGDQKYKTLAAIAAIITGTYFGSRALEAVRNTDQEEFDEDTGEVTVEHLWDRSLVRGFVRKWWVPVLDTDFNLLSLNDVATSSDPFNRPVVGNPNVWHYMEFEDESGMVGTPPTPLPLGNDWEWGSVIPDEIAYLLQTTQVLGQLDESSMLRIWKSVTTVQLKPEEILMQRGDPDDQLYVLTKGAMEVAIVEDGNQRIILKNVEPGGQIYSILSFIDVITGDMRPIKTVEVKATTDSAVIKIPIKAFREHWLEQPELLIISVRRLIRRIYQLVFVALHKVLGLAKELIVEQVRQPLNEAFLADAATKVSPAELEKAIMGVMSFFGLGEPKYRHFFEQAAVVLVGADTVLASPGERATNFVYVYKGELEVSQVLQDLNHEEQTEVMFYVPDGGAVGGLSFLTEDINIFKVRVPTKAIIVLLSEGMLQPLYKQCPTAVLRIAHSIVIRLSTFTRQMDFGIEWLHSESGSEPIYKVGDEPEYTYLVLSGRLRSILNDNGKKVVMGEYGKNDWVGLVETLTRRKRSKTVLPVRDTELAKIPDGVLQLIKIKFPIVTIRLLDFLGRRVARNYKSGGPKNEVTLESMMAESPTQHGCRTICILPTTANIPTLCVAYEIKKSLLYTTGMSSIITYGKARHRFGRNVLSKTNDYLLTSWFSGREDNMALVIYVADEGPTPWSQKCVQQADVIMILANAQEPCIVSDLENFSRIFAPLAKKELVLLHHVKLRSTESETALGQAMPTHGVPTRTRDWLQVRKWLNMHHHIKINQAHISHIESDFGEVKAFYDANWTYDANSDFARLTRWLTGEATGIVLGGGGAKGGAHIGFLKAALEHSIPIDAICGVSIGAFVGGLYALHQDYRKMDHYAQNWFCSMTRWYQYMMDMTIPIVSVFKGEAFNNSLKEAFGDVQIEDLWIPYFCLTTDVTGSGPRLHRCGSLWRYCRASMGLIGYFPPLCDPMDGHYLMDGGYTNLVPANVMRDFGARYILAVDVSSEEGKGVTNYGDQLSGFRVLMHKILPFLNELKVPNLFALQSQLAFVQSALYLEIVKGMDHATVYVRPPIDEFAAADFHCYQQIKETGYEFGSETFNRVNSSYPLALRWAQMNPSAQIQLDDRNLAAIVRASFSHVSRTAGVSG